MIRAFLFASAAAFTLLRQNARGRVATTANAKAVADDVLWELGQGGRPFSRICE